MPGGEAVAAAVFGVENGGVLLHQGADQRAEAVGVVRVEFGVFGERRDTRQCAFAFVFGLHRKPFVHHQRQGAVALQEVGKRCFAVRVVLAVECEQGVHARGHVVGVLVFGQQLLAEGFVFKERQGFFGQAAQFADARVFDVVFGRCRDGRGFEPVHPVAPHFQREDAHDAVVRGNGGAHVHRVGQGVEQGVERRDFEQQCFFGFAAFVVRQHRLHDVVQGGAVFAQFARFFQCLFEEAAVEDLHGFEAGEAIRRVRDDGGEFVVVVAVLVIDGRGEVLHQDRDEVGICPLEGPGGTVFFEEQGLFVVAVGEAVEAAAAVDEREADGDDQRARRGDGFDVLHGGDGEAAFVLVPGGGEGDFWRAAGGVPVEELAGEVVFAAVTHGLREVFDAHCLAVVALDVAFHALLESGFAQHGVVHADDFCAFFVHGRGVEVVDGGVFLRLHRVAHGTCIFGELHGAQADDVTDALQRAFAQVGGEFLVTEDGQPFFERELEPVAAGDAVARPVVEVFVADDGADAVVVFVGRGVGVGQHEAGIEDVERFVFHRPHVEVADGDDVELFEVVREAEAFFVPVDGVNQ